MKTCQFCGDESYGTCECHESRNAVKNEMTSKLNRVFELHDSSLDELEINVNYTTLQFSQYERYGISMTETVKHVSVSNRGFRDAIWGYIITSYENDVWKYNVLDVHGNSITDKDKVKELLTLCAEIFLRTDSDRGHSLRITKVCNGVYDLKIPQIKYTYERSDWFYWFD
jgi:hypothetical protein